MFWIFIVYLTRNTPIRKVQFDLSNWTFSGVLDGWRIFETFWSRSNPVAYLLAPVQYAYWTRPNHRKSCHSKPCWFPKCHQTLSPNFSVIQLTETGKAKRLFTTFFMELLSYITSHTIESYVADVTVRTPWWRQESGHASCHCSILFMCYNTPRCLVITVSTWYHVRDHSAIVDREERHADIHVPPAALLPRHIGLSVAGETL